jgi:DNA topoisomerase-1
MFVGCSSFPDCNHTQPIPKPVKIDAEDIAEAKRLWAAAPKCQKCGAAMRKIEGKYGPFLGCSNYPRCHETSSIAASEISQPTAPTAKSFEETERERMKAAIAELGEL